MGRLCSRLTVCLLASLCLYAAHVDGMPTLHDAAEHTLSSQLQGSDYEQEVFIFPILVCGPNNQKRDIRNYAALAKELGARMVLTGLFKHYVDNRARVRARQLSTMTPDEAVLPACFMDTKAGYMPFEQILDRAPFDDMLGAATVSDLKARGWDGQLDAIVVDGRPGVWEKHNLYVFRALQAANVTLPEHAPRIHAKSPLLCSKARLSDLRAKIRPFKFVAMVKVLLSATVLPDLEAEASLDVGSLDGCAASLYTATRMLRPAPWIRNVARKFVEDKLGAEAFLALHVRPYPDTCLQEWQMGNAKPGVKLRGVCYPQLATLHDKLVPCALKAARRSNIRKVFVMSHPMIQDIVVSLLEAAGFEDIVSITNHDVARLAGCRDFSSTFLSMVEEAVAVQAAQFIGTHQSSITQSLVFERLGEGRTEGSAYWETMQCCSSTTARNCALARRWDMITHSTHHGGMPRIHSYISCPHCAGRFRNRNSLG